METACFEPCSCDNSVAGRTYYTCAYGDCRGYKCQSCGAWMAPQWRGSCSRYSIPKADTPEGEVQILEAEVADLKARLKMRNRQIRDLRRQLRK